MIIIIADSDYHYRDVNLYRQYYSEINRNFFSVTEIDTTSPSLP